MVLRILFKALGVILTLIGLILILKYGWVLLLIGLLLLI